MNSLAAAMAALLTIFLAAAPAWGHHTLGINQSGKATESPQIPADHEIVVRDFLFQVTVLPAHPEPEELTRVIVTAQHIPTGKPYQGILHFRIAENIFFWEKKALLEESHHPIDGRYVQAVEFPASGNQTVHLTVKDHGATYQAHFPLTVGNPFNFWRVGLGVLAALALGWVVLRARLNRKRLRPI